MLSQMTIFHSYLWLNVIYIQIYTTHIFFILSSTDGHLGCFQVLAIVNNAAWGCIYLFKLAFLSSLDKWIAGSYGSSNFRFLKTLFFSL